MAGRISLRPSDAETWTACTMQPVFICDNHDLIPEDDGSVWSKEGNLAHDFAEKMLKGEEVTIPDPQMRVILEGYVDFVLAKWNPGDTLVAEQQVPLWYMPARHGKIDATVIRFLPNNAHGNIYVTDLKYGEGVAVYARENKQLAIYGRSTVEMLIKAGHKVHADTLITLSIYQPRCARGEPITIWALSWAELTEYTDEIAHIAADIQARRNLKWHKSKSTCKWCKAAAICPEIARKNLGTTGVNMLDAVFPELIPDEIRQLPAVEHMSLEMMQRVLALKEDFSHWFTAIDKHLFNLLRSGYQGPDLRKKLVANKDGNREWLDSEAATILLEGYLPIDVYAPRKIISAPQAEKLIPKKKRADDFDMMWDMLVRKKPSDGFTMVDLDDERPSEVMDATTEFQPVTDLEGADLL